MLTPDTRISSLRLPDKKQYLLMTSKFEAYLDSLKASYFDAAKKSIPFVYIVGREGELKTYALKSVDFSWNRIYPFPETFNDFWWVSAATKSEIMDIIQQLPKNPKNFWEGFKYQYEDILTKEKKDFYFFNMKKYWADNEDFKVLDGRGNPYFKDKKNAESYALYLYTKNKPEIDRRRKLEYLEKNVPKNFITVWKELDIDEDFKLIKKLETSTDTYLYKRGGFSMPDLYVNVKGECYWYRENFSKMGD